MELGVANMPRAYHILAGLTLLPLLFRLIPLFLPAHYLESYAWWDASTLNTLPAAGERQLTWRNMGYWKVRI